MDRPDGSDELRQPADTPEPTAGPDAEETARDSGDVTTIVPRPGPEHRPDPEQRPDPERQADPEQQPDPPVRPGTPEPRSDQPDPDQPDPGQPVPDHPTANVPAHQAAPPTRTGVPGNPVPDSEQPDQPTTAIPTDGTAPTQTGAPTAGPTATGPQPTPATASDAPHYPGQRYPAVPGREGEPEIPGEQPWGPPPRYGTPDRSWTPPVDQREQRAGRWIAGLTAVIVLALAAIGGGAWFLVTALSGPTVPAGYRPVDTPYLTYAVPGDWTPLDDVSARGLGVAFTGGADAPGYVCRSAPYKRGTATSALVRSPDDPATLARRFAAEFGRSFYTSTAGRGPRVAVSQPRTVEIGDATGVVVEAVSTTPVDDGCLATGGRTLVLAVPVPAGGTALLLANADTAGGPVTPPLVPPATVEDIIGTAAVPAR